MPKKSTRPLAQSPSRLDRTESLRVMVSPQTLTALYDYAYKVRKSVSEAAANIFEQAVLSIDKAPIAGFGLDTPVPQAALLQPKMVNDNPQNEELQRCLDCKTYQEANSERKNCSPCVKIWASPALSLHSKKREALPVVEPVKDIEALQKSLEFDSFLNIQPSKERPLPLPKRAKPDHWVNS